jgi:hypothetical protein
MLKNIWYGRRHIDEEFKNSLCKGLIWGQFRITESELWNST